MSLSNHRSGILSQTMISSPCIKWILSARLRSPLHQDVVFVGSSNIHLREFKEDGLLTDVSARLELGVRILAANVISAKSHVVSIQDKILENGKDEVRYTIRGEPCSASEPPQILVLSLASSELVYVYAKETVAGTIRFVHAKKAVFGGMSGSEKHGYHLAVDHESRAMAVAPSMNTFTLLSLRDVDEVKREIDNWNPREPSSIMPVKEQRAIEVDGMILKVDFLQSTTLQPETVFLLLVVAKDGRTRMLLYSWDSRRPLHKVTLTQSSGQLLQHEDDLPLLLIPFRSPKSFAIVTQTKILCYDNIMTTNNRLSLIERPIPISSQDKGKIWVQWVKAFRHKKHEKENEEIFLIREDGYLVNFKVHNSSGIGLQVFPGILGIRVDSAACMLQSPPTMSGDILIAAGDMTEGGVFQIRPRQCHLRLQTIPNWSPIHDMVIMDKHSSRQICQTQSATFVTAGRLKDTGALMQLNYGLEALVAWTIGYPDAATIDRLWTLKHGGGNHLLLLLSHYEYTTAMTFDLQNEDIIVLDELSCPELNFAAPTLAAAEVPGSAVLQITSRGIYILAPQSIESKAIEVGEGSYHLCAQIDRTSGLFAIAINTPEGVELLMGIANASTDSHVELSIAPNRQSLDFVPVVLSLASVHGTTYSFAVSQEGKLHIYILDPANGLQFLQNYEILKPWSLKDSEYVASLSIATFLDASHALLLCGLKSGLLVSAKVDMTGSAVSIRVGDCKSMGDTSVHIKEENAEPSTSVAHAVVLCGVKIWRISMFHDQGGLEHTIDSIWVTSKETQAYTQISITALDRIPRLSTDGDDKLSGLFVFSSGEDLLMCVCSDKKAVTRQVANLSAPRLILYSKQVQKFIVGVTEPPSGDDTNAVQFSSRSLIPTLQFVDPRNAGTQVGDDLLVVGKAGERIRVLLEWCPTDGETHYEMVLIVLENGIDGRIDRITGKSLSGQTSMPRVRSFFNFPGKPVQTICAHGFSSLAVGAGNDIRVLRLNFSTKQVETQAVFALPSTAISVTSRGSLIFVATSLHSFIVLREEGGTLQMLNHARWAGTAKHIIPYADSSLIVNLVSDQGSIVLGFADRLQRASQPMFEAHVPFAIDRLFHSNQASIQDGRHRFHGAAIDGTIYLFKTLTSDETKLLKFLEQLVKPYHSARLMKLGLRAGRKSVLGRLDAGNIIPSDGGSSHVRGDILENMLEPNRLNIRSLLQSQIKIEDGTLGDEEEDDYRRLQALARPVLYPDPPTIEAVNLWLRQLLHIPSF